METHYGEPGGHQLVSRPLFPSGPLTSVMIPAAMVVARRLSPRHPVPVIPVIVYAAVWG